MWYHGALGIASTIPVSRWPTRWNPPVCRYESRVAAQRTAAWNQNSYRGRHAHKFYSSFTASRPAVCQLNFLSEKKTRGSSLSGVLSGRDVKMESSQSIDRVKNSLNYVSTPPVGFYCKVCVRIEPTWLLSFFFLLCMFHLHFYFTNSAYYSPVFSFHSFSFISSVIHMNVSYPSVSIK